MDIDVYNHVRSGGAGFIEMPRGLIAVWGKEAVQFLDGMITNDMKTLEDGQQMFAAFPNAQGRLLAVVRVLRQGDRFLIETEEATREKVFQNLFRFTFAGDFFVEDVSEGHKFFHVFNAQDAVNAPILRLTLRTMETWAFANDELDAFEEGVKDGSIKEIPLDVYDVLRVENGEPLYGIDMDESTVVPELGLDGLISYKKGCYIGQEIIARIHFRGHVAKQLAGLLLKTSMSDEGVDMSTVSNNEVKTMEGKIAGRITSLTFSPNFNEHTALAYIRYDHLAEGTELFIGETPAILTKLPFVTS